MSFHGAFLQARLPLLTHLLVPAVLCYPAGAMPAPSRVLGITGRKWKGSWLRFDLLGKQHALTITGTMVVAWLPFEVQCIF